jgi:parallel beta-helix repeat protein
MRNHPSRPPLSCAVGALACALLSSFGGGADAATAVGAAPTPVETSTAPAAAVLPTLAETVGKTRALSADARLDVHGVTEVPPPAPTLATTSSSGRIFHVDSRVGDDTSNGLAATASSNGVGPWKSLARVMQSSLGPGDTLVLACGSSWRETLRVPANGTAAKPVRVMAPAAGCDAASRPTVDGSIALPAASWRLQSGAIWETRVDQPVLAVTSSSAVWRIAHYPNRGYRTEEPASPYLSLAANSTNSTTLETGSAIQLPAGVRLQDGARVRVRTNEWWMDDARVTAFDGSRITVGAPLRYPAQAGFGYYFVGQRWMLDSPNEWFHDAAAGNLLVWMPGGTVPDTPLQATVLATGIDLSSRTHVTLEGLAVRRVGTGVIATSSIGVQLRNLQVEDTVGAGVEASISQFLAIDSSSLLRTGADAIQGDTHLQGSASDLSLRNSVVRDSAVRMEGEVATTLPVATYAAVSAGARAVVSGNVIVNSGYIGMRVGSGSEVQGNFVYGACSQLDDCGGIYTWSSSKVTIRGNTVIRSRGTAFGKPASRRSSAAQGIYLDESANDVRVDNNTVVDADHGIQLHVSSRNTLSGNRLFANRRSQIWLQSTRNKENAAGDVVGNVITGNQIAAAVPGSVGIWLSNSIGPTSAFGTIDNNQYADRGNPTVVLDSTPTGTRSYTLAQWQAATTPDLPAGRDSAGSGTIATPFAAYRVGGANIVPNAGLATNTAGWTTHSATAPAPGLQRAACPRGWCLTLLAGGSNSLVASPNFRVVAGQWYRLTVDLLGDQDKQPVMLILRRGGGGSNGYESLSDRSLQTTAERGWRRHTVTFQATKTVNARDPVTGDLGARIDIEGVLPGRSITLANLELIPVTLSSTALLTGAMVNVGNSEIQSACPMSATQAAACTRLMRLSDHTPLAWPLRVPARSTVLYYGQDPSLADSDRDGIADSQDSCPETPAGSAVSAAGCSLGQR